MTQTNRYRTLYEHEKDCNHKMLSMFESVPNDARGDARFHKAVRLADHLAACRENWLDHMDGNGKNQVAWWNEHCDFAALRPRFATLEHRWTEYLSRLEDGQLSQEFEFTESDEEIYRLPIEVQIEQLIGHAAYHRGQIVLLLDQMGVETPDTDYVDWWWARQS